MLNDEIDIGMGLQSLGDGIRKDKWVFILDRN